MNPLIYHPAGSGLHKGAASDPIRYPCPMNPSLLLVAILAAVALWAASLRARERALGATHKACRELDVQLLDETVALEGLWVGRDPRGRLRLRRRYAFEFTPDGLRRHSGRAELVGAYLRALHFRFPDGTTILGPEGRRDRPDGGNPPAAGV